MKAFRVFHLAAPPLLLAAAIFLLSSGPTPGALPRFYLSDKLAHFAVYGLLGFFTARALAATQRNPWCVVTLTAALVGLYGISDEIHQSFIPGRFPDVFDAWADLAGATFAAPFGRLLFVKESCKWIDTVGRPS